jgi:hypothetical protein
LKEEEKLMKSLGGLARRHRVIVPVAIVALLIAAMGGVLTAQGKRHSHSVKVAYKTRTKTLAGDDVNFVLVFCRSGTKVTGFGADTSGNGVGVILQQNIDPSSNSGSALFENISSSSATMRGHLACIKKRTSRVRSKVSAANRAAALEAVRHKRDQLQAELNR